MNSEMSQANTKKSCAVILTTRLSGLVFLLSALNNSQEYFWIGFSIIALLLIATFTMFSLNMVKDDESNLYKD